MIDPPKATKAPNIERKAILDWQNGTVTDYDARRVVDNSLVSSANLILEQNGVIRPRPALRKYGPQPVGEVLGELFECKIMDGATPIFYLICMQKVDDVAHIYYAKGEDEEWTEITSKDYDTSARCHYLMIANKVLILNGVDKLSYIDLTDWGISQFEELSDPTEKPTLGENHGLDGTTFNVYYAVSANSTIGETAISPVLTTPVSTQRDLWNGDEQWITLNWTEVEGATSYNVYMGVSADGAGQPTLYLIADGLDASKLSFTDNGSRTQNLNHPAPSDNSTAGPKATRGAVINGRVWLIGDPDSPSRVWYGGDPTFELDFSTVNGGGWTTVASGTKEIPVVVKPFRRGTGDNTVVVLTQGSNGNGKRYHLTANTISYGNATFVAWGADEDGGSEGTDSPDGVVFHQNSLYYPSRSGFRTTGTMPQLQNVLSTTDVSATIRNQVQLLNNSALERAVGLVYEGRIYWAMPVGSTRNNRVWVFDLEHKGAWMLSWYLNVDWMTLYNDNSGETHFLMLIDNQIYETTRAMFTQDASEAFKTELKSGDIKFHKDGREWARLIQVVFTFLKPRGNFSVQVTAHTEDGDLTYTQSVETAQASTCRGWGEAEQHWSSARPWGYVDYDSAEADDVPDYVDTIVEIDEDVQWFSYRVASTETGVDYAINSVVAEYVSIGIKDLS